MPLEDAEFQEEDFDISPEDAEFLLKALAPDTVLMDICNKYGEGFTEGFKEGRDVVFRAISVYAYSNKGNLLGGEVYEGEYGLLSFLAGELPGFKEWFKDSQYSEEAINESLLEVMVKYEERRGSGAQQGRAAAATDAIQHPDYWQRSTARNPGSSSRGY